MDGITLVEQKSGMGTIKASTLVLIIMVLLDHQLSKRCMQTLSLRGVNAHVPFDVLENVLASSLYGSLNQSQN